MKTTDQNEKLAMRSTGLLELHGAAAWDANVNARAAELETNSDPAYRALTHLVLARLTEAHLEQGAKIIDAGAGLGYMSRAVAELGFGVVGVDPSAASIEFAETHNRRPSLSLEFEASSLENFSLDQLPATADAVLAIMALHSVEDVASFFDSAARLLRPNGSLFVVIPNPNRYLQTRADVDISNLDLSLEQKVPLVFRIKNHDPHPSLVDFYHRPVRLYSMFAHSAGLDIVDFDIPDQIGPGRPRDLMYIRFAKHS